MIFSPTFPLQESPMLLSWALFWYLFIILFNKYRYVSPLYPLRPSPSPLFLFCCFGVFILTDFCAGDYFHTIEFVLNTVVEQDVHEFQHFEAFYQHLSVFCGGNHWYFRVIVWWGALFLVGLTARRLCADCGLVFFIVFVFAAVNFSAGRMYLGMAVYFLGLSFLIKPWGKIGLPLSYLLGIVIMLQAPFFHRSMYGLLATTPLFFLPNFIGARGTYYRIVVVGAGGIVATLFLAGMLFVFDFSFLDERTAGVSEHINSYLENEAGLSIFTALMVSPSAFLLSGVALICRVLNLFLITNVLVNGNLGQDSKIEQVLFRFYFAMTIASLVMGMMGGLNQFGGRIGSMALIPSAILIARLWRRGIMDFKTFRNVLVLGGAYTFLFVWYSWYCTWAHGIIYR